MTLRPSRRQFLGLATTAIAAPVALTRARADAPASLIVWEGRASERFGGFSAIELMPDRLGFLALSDRGFLTRGELSRDGAGRLISARRIEQVRLADRNGRALHGVRADSEGLDLSPDGRLLVSFEGHRRTRIQRYAGFGRPGPQLSRHADWHDLPRNSGLEAVAVDERGTVFTLPEMRLHGGFPLYRFQGETWEIVAVLPERNGFFPVGADFGPDGNLYLLERKFRLAFFASRISRLTPGAWDQPQTLYETTYGSLDNHEGICVTADAQGALWATTISDDNNNRFQRTEIAEFRLN